MHGDDVWQPENPRCRSPIHCHCELMAVNGIDPIFAEEPDKSLHAAGIDWPVDAEHLRREAASPEQVAQPTHSVLGSHWNDGVTPRSELV